MIPDMEKFFEADKKVELASEAQNHFRDSSENLSKRNKLVK